VTPRLSPLVALLAAWLAGSLLGSCAPGTHDGSAAPEPRPPVEVRAAVDRAVATVGDRLTYTVTVDRAHDVEVDVPPLNPELAGLVALDAPQREVHEEGERVIEDHRLTLRVDEVGSYVLPPVTVRWGGEEGEESEQTVETSPLFIEVESMLERAREAGEEVTDIRGLKPLQRPGPDIPWPWIAAGAVLAAVFAGALIWLLRRRRQRSQTPPRPAHEVALERIAELEGWDRTDAAVVHRLFFELSEAVRVYVEDRYGLNATDLTTEEIVVALPGVTGLETEPALELRRFLVATDWVKFADHQPPADEVAATLAQARGFVESTRLRDPESPDGNGGESTGHGDGNADGRAQETEVSVSHGKGTREAAA